jgi:hypothetical protein
LEHTWTPGAITPQTVSLRVGHGNAGAGSMFMNGSPGGRVFGGSMAAVLTVEEIKA